MKGEYMKQGQIFYHAKKYGRTIRRNFTWDDKCKVESDHIIYFDVMVKLFTRKFDRIESGVVSICFHPCGGLLVSESMFPEVLDLPHPSSLAFLSYKQAEHNSTDFESRFREFSTRRNPAV